MSFTTIFTELIIGYVALLTLTKILGKTTITQISLFDFIAVLILGELLSGGMYTEHTTWKHILFAMVTWGTLIYTTSLVTQKFRKSRKIFEGEPSIIINNGQIDYQVMKKNLLDLNQLQMLLRIQGVFSLREVNFVILEANGELSVMKKSIHDTPTNSDMNIAPKTQSLSYSLILDGEIVEENLRIIEKTKKWLETEIKSDQIRHVKDVLFAEWNNEDGLFVQKYSCSDLELS